MSAQQKTGIQVLSTMDRLMALLKLLNITRVYYVDDENNLTDFDFQIVTAEIERIYGLEKDVELNSIECTGWDRELPKEGVVDSLSTLWPNLTFENKISVYSRILRITNAEDQQLDFKRAARVGEQIPTGIIKILSPREWDEEKKSLPDFIKGGQRALVLFDEDLKHAGVKYVSVKGQDLIVEVKKMSLGDKVICTLLTHKISEAKEELTFRDVVIRGRADNDLDENDFFPLAKKRLDEAEVFADGIKKALLNSYFETIKKHTVEVIEESYKQATEKIKKFDTYDFDETILRSSEREGVWEPETILRISDIVFDNELKKKMADTNYALKVNPQLKVAQKFANISFQVPIDVEPYNKRILRHHELYDDGKVINALRKPLENGDIFQIGEAKYILVAQACDMMIRAKGSKQGNRNAKTATLLKIDVHTHDSYKKKRDKNDFLKDKYPLPYFRFSTDDVGVVEFTDYIVVDIDFLDLCVYNADGHSRMNARITDVNLNFLSEAWVQRHEILKTKLQVYDKKISEIRVFLNSRKRGLTAMLGKILPQKILSRLSSLTRRSKMDHQIIEKEFYPKIILASTSQIEQSLIFNDKGLFDFSFKRIAKYKEFGATYLLERYTKHLSRAAEPHDFALSKN